MEYPFYSKLDYARREIRLLEIHKDDDNSLVCCTTRTLSLNDITNLNALSYCWGDPNVTAPIMVNDHVMNITINLEKALRQLRRSDVFKEEIWIDAICINQANAAEKTQQVPLMKDIYSVSKVFVWLGESDAPTDLLIPSIKEIDITKWSALLDRESPSRVANLLCLSINLVSKPWWQRTWTFQEFLLAQEVTFMCGPHISAEAELAAFFSFLDPLSRRPIDEQPWMPEFVYRMIHMSPDWFEGGQSLWAGFLDNKTNIADFFTMRESFLRERHLDLNVAMIRSVLRRATDPRDKIFALLGLVPDSERKEIPVD